MPATFYAVGVGPGNPENACRKQPQASLVIRCGRPEEKIYKNVRDFPEETEYLSLIIVK